jgi:hypothetical protein
MANTNFAKTAWLSGVVLVAAAVAGCGSDGLITKGEFCQRTGSPVCDRFVSCGVIAASMKSACTSDYQAGCCGDNNSCGDRAETKDEESQIEALIADCTAALPTADCAQLAAGNPPIACGGNAAVASLLYTPAASPVRTLAPTVRIDVSAEAHRLGKFTAGKLLRPSAR